MVKKRVLLLLHAAALVCVLLALATWGPLLPVAAAATEDDVAEAGEVMEALKETVEVGGSQWIVETNIRPNA